MGAGHEPSRMCVICSRRFAKSQLLRHVLSSSGGEGTLEADEAQKKPGRGWYVCSAPACREKFAKMGRPKSRRKGV